MSKIYKESVEYNEYIPTDKDLEEACKRSYSNNMKIIGGLNENVQFILFTAIVPVIYLV